MASDLRKEWKSRRALLILLSAFCAWALWFIFRNSFVLGDTRYFVLKDDAMISMTYAKNFANGLGLNWARHGPPVEGYTHPLWALLMIPVHWLPISLAKTGLIVQLMSLALLAANLVALRVLVVTHFGAGRHRHWLPAVALTAAYYPLNYWALLGMETAFQALLTTVAVTLALGIVHDGRDSKGKFTTLSVVLASAVLLRMDMLLMAGGVLGYAVLGGGRRPWRRWMTGALLFALVCAGYELFRWLYFGDWLPNTYYLKMTGVPASLRILRGALVFLDFAKPIALPLAIVLGGSFALALTSTRRKLILPLGLLVGYLLYAIYVGGDAWRLEKMAGNRFVAFAMPLCFALANALLNELLDRLDRGGRPSRARDASILASVTLIFALVANGFLSEGFSKRWHEIVAVSPSGLAVDLRARILLQTLELGDILEPEAMVAVVWAGIPAYFSDYRMADMLGFNDRHIARGPSAIRVSVEEPLRFVPGHNKFDPGYTLGRQKPDLVFQLWTMSGDQLQRVMRRHGYVKRKYWVRRDSQYLRNGRDPEPGRRSGSPGEGAIGGRSEGLGYPGIHQDGPGDEP